MAETIENGWYSLEEYRGIKVGDSVYIADIQPLQGVYETTDCHVRSIRTNDKEGRTYYVALEENKLARSRVFAASDVGVYVFVNRYDAELVVEDAKAENRDVEVSDEVDYDE